MDINDLKYKAVLNNKNLTLPKAKQKALAMLSFRAYFKAELLFNLEKEFGKNIAKQVLKRLEELGLINDLELSKKYVQELFEKGFSNLLITQKLEKKGVDRNLAKHVVKEFEQSVTQNSSQRILKILNIKYPNFKSEKKILNKAMSTLCRYGYSWEEIEDVTNSFRGTSF
ncbi:MAG: RecX family transcriptional regulator [Oscillospiraceae bacterium]|jgi:SOS response regulatory protein OraA/RecX|nr:RecX family transcriptional regulator [Oscillospiraceae bacterium]